MNVIEHKGDLFSTECRVIMHGCNAQGVMGSGVAKIIRDQFPKAYTEYLELAKSGLVLGNIQLVDCGEKIIINAITQEYFGRDGKKYVSYDAIHKAFSLVDRGLHKAGITSVAIPEIGCGLGGGEWSVVKPIIESACKNIQVHLYRI
jgi:O-acetyl-ADP-ribose deacetylase (regulator of RNase III)